MFIICLFHKIGKLLQLDAVFKIVGIKNIIYNLLAELI